MYISNHFSSTFPIKKIAAQTTSSENLRKEEALVKLLLIP
ncbi:hypothetical protein AVDCRST_MAG81-2864 [uncultured Synechococcales cyanobacterium]|uniref:Uncharacterized protein n=1 Tax=uncultured Synechococcales cyanobacterium TaxID=1936017 RepID=A0A6J4VMD2_9CYAN|nr:hypothetical protein AVDCRST_MAG81-2864 [uncultured Synechococcales cyanobacterium]